jgi:uncharacterized membrane protein
MALLKQGIGTSLATFLKATIVGGLLFLLPVVLLLIILGQAMRLAGKVAQPISAALHVDTVAGVGGVTVLAVLVLIFISFLAGLVARTKRGNRIMRWSESSLLGGLPQYQLVKTNGRGSCTCRKR